MLIWGVLAPDFDVGMGAEMYTGLNRAPRAGHPTSLRHEGSTGGVTVELLMCGLTYIDEIEEPFPCYNEHSIRDYIIGRRGCAISEVRGMDATVAKCPN